MVAVKIGDVKVAVELLTLFAKRASFQLPEYEQVGGLFGRLAKFLEGAESADAEVDASLTDLKYVVSVINVCSQRTPVEVQNFRLVADLVDKFTQLTQDDDSEQKTEL